MPAPGTRKRLDLGSLLILLCGGAALAHLLAFLAVALSRASYPFELEWLEGGVLQEVRRLLAGKAIYAAPSPEYVPFMYAPLYFKVAAWFSPPQGSFLPLRLLSLLATLGSAFLVFDWIRKETRRAAPAVIAAGLFIAAFKPSGFWFDLARVDSLFLFFCLLGLRLLASSPRPAAAVLAAAAFSAAFHTKQSALPMVACMLPYALLRGRAYAAAFAGGAALGMGGVAWLLDRASGGWYFYYVFAAPSGHPLVPGAALGFWTRDLAAVFPLPLLLAVFSVWRPLADRETPTAVFRLCSGVGMIGAAWMSRLHSGGWDNVLMPAYAWLALAAGWGLGELRFPEHPRAALIGAALIAQLAWLRYDPFAQIPKAADAKAGEMIAARIAAYPGEVYLPDHGYLAARAGKRQRAHRMAFQDILRGRGATPAARAETALDSLLRQRFFSALILDTPDLESAGIFPADASASYVLTDSLPLPGRLFMTVTGVKSRPAYIFTPR